MANGEVKLADVRSVEAEPRLRTNEERSIFGRVIREAYFAARFPSRAGSTESTTCRQLALDMFIGRQQEATSFVDTDR